MTAPLTIDRDGETLYRWGSDIRGKPWGDHRERYEDAWYTPLSAYAAAKGMKLTDGKRPADLDRTKKVLLRDGSWLHPSEIFSWAECDLGTVVAYHPLPVEMADEGEAKEDHSDFVKSLRFSANNVRLALNAPASICRGHLAGGEHNQLNRAADIIEQLSATPPGYALVKKRTAEEWKEEIEDYSCEAMSYLEKDLLNHLGLILPPPDEYTRWCAEHPAAVLSREEWASIRGEGR